MSRAKSAVVDWLKQYDAQAASGPGPTSPYRFGRLDRATRHYQPPNVSGDLAVVESGELMHARTRDGVRNNASFKKAVEVWQDLIVGGGMQTLADPFEPWIDIASLTPEELDARLDYALESDELFAEWFNDAKQFDAESRLTGAEFQRMAIRELVTVGEVFIVEILRPSNDPEQVPLCYQLIESDQRCRQINRQRTATDNKIVEGVELDEWNREVAFYLYDENQTDVASASAKVSRIPVERCLHLYRPQRPTQHLGASELAACAQPMVDRDKLLTTELQTAAKVAALALVHKNRKGAAGSLGIAGSSDNVDNYGNSEVRLGSSPVSVHIGTDEDVQVVESNRPNPDIGVFLKTVDLDTAAGASISPYSLRGNYEATSFSSARAAKLDEDQHFGPLQQWFAACFALPMRRRFNELAALMGLIQNAPPSEFVANRKRFQRFEAMGPGRELLDPSAETEAAISRLRGSLSTLKIECGRRGLHWVRVLRQKALENRLAEVLGIVLDFSKGQGGQVTQSTSQQQQQQGAT